MGLTSTKATTATGGKGTKKKRSASHSTEISIGLGVTINVGNFESIRFDVSIRESTDKPEEVAEELLVRCMEIIDAAAEDGQEFHQHLSRRLSDGKKGSKKDGKAGKTPDKTHQSLGGLYGGGRD